MSVELGESDTAIVFRSGKHIDENEPAPKNVQLAMALAMLIAEPGFVEGILARAEIYTAKPPGAPS